MRARLPQSGALGAARWGRRFPALSTRAENNEGHFSLLGANVFLRTDMLAGKTGFPGRNPHGSPINEKKRTSGRFLSIRLLISFYIDRKLNSSVMKKET